MSDLQTQKDQPLPVAAIVLAAGQGSRMGGGKLLLPLGDATVIERTVQSLMAVPVKDLVVVLGIYEAAIKHQLLKFPVRFAVNLDPSSEMSESIRCGLRSLNPTDFEAFLILPADIPLVLPETIRKFVVAFLGSDKPIALPIFRNRLGHPVIFRSSFYERVRNFRSPQGIRPLVRGDPSQILLVEVDEEGVNADLDNWDDYRRLLSFWAKKKKPRPIGRGLGGISALGCTHYSAMQAPLLKTP